MKSFLQLTIALFAGALLFGSCDKVDDPYYKQITIDTTTQQVQKKVLLEDYTGHMCVNCPAAGNIAHNLSNTYGDRVVILAIHAGFFATPLPGEFSADYRTACGNEWDTYFGISAAGNPNGMVNRKNHPGNHILSPEAWSGAITEALDEPVTVDIKLKNTYTAAGRSLSTEAEVSFIEQTDKDLYLVLVLTESGIISPQKNNNSAVGPTPVIEDYEHNHVMRGAISDAWGTQIAAIGTANPAELTRTFNYTLPTHINAGNASVVAFIYDNETKEVLQAAEEKVTE